VRHPAVLRVAAISCLIAACSQPAATSAIAVVHATAPATTTATTAVAVTTSTSAPTTTTSAATTTTTVPSLDRSDKAALVRMRGDLEALLANGPRVSGTDAEAEAIAHIAAVMEEVTGTPAIREPVPLPNGHESANVWTDPVGSGDTELLIGAHLDTVGGAPGANDNGSGVVLILELLRRLADDPPTDLSVRIVGFGAEEVVPGYSHHYGSRVAAERMAADGTLPDLMISVDMVAIGEDFVVVHHTGDDPSFADRVAAVAEALGIPTQRIGRGNISDHVPFATAGVPSAQLWRSDDPSWHTPNDTVVDDAALLDALHVLEAVIAEFDRSPFDRVYRVS